MSMERIVRPFQTAFPFNARQFTLPEVVPPPDEVVVEWGSASGGSYRQWAEAGIFGGVVNYSEKSRVTETVRITNPDDPSQFVDVERIKQLVLASEKGEEIKFQMS